MRSDSVRGGDSARRTLEQEGGREGGGGGRESESRAGEGTAPGNDDWVLWRSGGRVGEERTARFLVGSLRDRYGLFPASCSQTERYRR